MLEHPTQGSAEAEQQQEGEEAEEAPLGSHGSLQGRGGPWTGRQSSSREGEEAEEAHWIPWLPQGERGPLDRENQVAPNTVYATLEQNLQMKC